ncbi:MAG: DUF2721 domain-containing protein [Acetobacter sp.]|jgi:hypothetical protein|nr:DUF2721 domain-containing protein [Acetobacter sp.]MCH4060330.1 DUF2721 domain-containing protein [Acetobacter sp.]MCH4087270.1 DUF2721 domain-containing protein [Acetobacter sp.]MCI1293091.1 DUF2721 domain-containing protein [Acetobacter sp.]MCI1319677.1 DUF2721 domain-containing protein [Acetobacter sp.]
MPLPIHALATESAGDVARLIETALTPVFMLSGVGTLLNLFNTRLARVSDHIEKAADLLENSTDEEFQKVLESHLLHLRRRTVVLDVAILFAGAAGATTCGAAFVLFLGSLSNASIAFWLVLLFGGALISTTFALASFLGDSILAWHTLRKEGPLPKSEKRNVETE